MPRTTPALMDGIIDVDLNDDPNPFIKAANLLLTRVCVLPSTYYNEVADAEQLQEIETWLAAHFYTVWRGRSYNEQAGSVQETLQSKVDLRLYTSHYGQHAILLDTSGLLAAYNNSLGKATMPLPGLHRQLEALWLGTDSEEATDVTGTEPAP